MDSSQSWGVKAGGTKPEPPSGLAPIRWTAWQVQKEPLVPDITRQLDGLRSTNRNTRYSACEELRVAPSISSTAVHALEQALSDPDPAVADAAKRALRAHMLDSLTGPAGLADRPSGGSSGGEAETISRWHLLAVAFLSIGIPLAVPLVALIAAGYAPGDALFTLNYALMAPHGSGSPAGCLVVGLFLSPIPAVLILRRRKKGLALLVAALSGIVLCLGIAVWSVVVFTT